MSQIILSKKPIIAKSKIVIKTKNTGDDDVSDTDTNVSTLTNVDEIYQDKDLREHIYTLPDTYIGAIDPERTDMWIWDVLQERMISKNVKFIPGLYKIYDEILVNAIDQQVRMLEKIKLRNQIKEGKSKPTAEVPDGDIQFRPVKYIKISVDAAANRISVENDGDGIDVEIHKKLGIYVPQMIFGKLLTSTNYQEDVKRIVGGKNGYGAKLTNIFSKEFTIETVDAYRKRRYKQTFRENMTIIDEPEIEEGYIKVPFTRITFVPDLKRFKLDTLDNDTIQIMKKRAYDTAACTTRDVTVYWNDHKLEAKSFEKYVDLYIGPKSETKRCYAEPNDRWEICACPSPDHTFQQVSFTNGICTNRGGKHVEHVATQICKKLAEYANDKKKGLNLKPIHIRNNLWLFVRATLENPSFDTQTKECVTSKVSEFGSKCTIDDEFIVKLSKTGIVEKAMALSQFKDNQKLKDTDGKKRSKISNPKLDEGKYVGTNKSIQCTLILTEGDSAKTFAQSGLKALTEEERKYYGVFPLKGKLLNVRDATTKQISENQEITELKRIIGLQQGMDCDKKIAHLRYGSVMIITDQDPDGDHIKGLLMNFFHYFWPSLLQRNTSIKSMITPLVRVWKMKKKGKRTLKDLDSVVDLYSEQEYETWKAAHAHEKGWNCKYYKGLGTSDAQEARDCFSNMKIVNYTWDKEETVIEENTYNKTDFAIMLAFKKGFEDSRKEWIQSYDPQLAYDFTISEETYSDFINKRLIGFSYEDCIRSIPSICDGLKVSQRKIIYAAIKKKLKKDVKVAQFGGYVGENTDYKHGEASLFSTIVSLAQDYVGSNNLNLLEPSGQFGSRMGSSKNGIGKDSASPRYIYTRMNDLTPYLFNPYDNPLFKYIKVDNDYIEPEYYVPILPMVLVNGATGIGTGYSTSIPSYNPLHLIENIKQLIKGEPLIKMTPWYHGFKGDIYPKTEKTYSCHGVYQVLNSNQIEITELPISETIGFLEYKKFILSILDGAINKTKDGKDKTTKHILSDKLIDADFDITDTTIRVVLTFAPQTLQGLLEKKDKLEKDLKLISSIACTNMHLFNSENKITKYNSAEEILQEYYGIRVKYYIRRKAYLLEDMEEDYQKVSAKAQFIRDIHDDKILITEKVNGKNKPKKKSEIEDQLVNLEYPKFGRKNRHNYNAVEAPPLVEEEENKGTELVIENPSASYDYLLSMRIDSLTEEMVQKLEAERDILYEKLESLKSKTPEMLWSEDLDEFQKIYLEWLGDWYEKYGIQEPNAPIKLIKKKLTYKKTPTTAPKKITIVKKT